jgi:hypothetical protein
MACTNAFFVRAAALIVLHFGVTLTSLLGLPDFFKHIVSWQTVETQRLKSDFQVWMIRSVFFAAEGS